MQNYELEENTREMLIQLEIICKTIQQCIEIFLI